VKDYPHNLKIQYPENHLFKSPILVAFSDDPHNTITFFAGFGFPWKISSSVEFAKILTVGEVNAGLIVAALLREYELTFTVMEMSDAIKHDYSCSICAYSWSIQDREYASAVDGGVQPASTYPYITRDQLPIGSPFHNCSPEEREEHIKRIVGSRICANESCHSLSCGSEECRITSRGRGAKVCIPCRKAQSTRRNRRGQ